MVGSVPVVLLALAFIFAIFAAFKWPQEGRVSWGWFAFMWFIASLLLGGPLGALLMR